MEAATRGAAVNIFTRVQTESRRRGRPARARRLADAGGVDDSFPRAALADGLNESEPRGRRLPRGRRPRLPPPRRGGRGAARAPDDGRGAPAAALVSAPTPTRRVPPRAVSRGRGPGARSRTPPPPGRVQAAVAAFLAEDRDAATAARERADGALVSARVARAAAARSVAAGAGRGAPRPRARRWRRSPPGDGGLGARERPGTCAGASRAASRRRPRGD